MPVETWRLHHPTIGLIEFETGTDEDFRAAYSDWPVRTDEGQKDSGLLYLSEQSQRSKGHDASRVQESTREEKTVSKEIRLSPAEAFGRFANNLRARAQLKVNGEPIRRYGEIRAARIPLSKKLGNRLSEMSDSVDRRKPHLKIQKGLLGDIQVVTFHQTGQVAELEPPPGSRGEAYYDAVQSSAFKRTALPIVSGLGKGGWALAVLVLGPLVGRLMDWLLSFLPDFELPSLPPLPDIELPLPTLPTVVLPVPNMPDLDLPGLPGWLTFIMSYAKIWIPILIGIVLGITALRNSKKSDNQKEQWKAMQRKHSQSNGSSPDSPERSHNSETTDYILFNSYPDSVNNAEENR